VQLENCTAASVLRNLGIDLESIRADIELIVGRGEPGARRDIGLTPRSKRAIELAIEEARSLNHGDIGTGHLLLGLIREGAGVAAGVLESLGVALERTRAEVERIHDDRPPPARRLGRFGPTNWTPAFGEHGIDLTVTEERSGYQPAAHSVRWVDQLVQVLAAETAANPIAATADPTALQPVLELLARRMAQGEVPEPLKGKRLISLSFQSVVRGATTRREFEQRVEELVAQAAAAGNCVLVVEDDTALPDGEGGALAAAVRLRAHLAAGRLQCIVAAGTAAFQEAVERNPGLGALYTPVDLRLANGELPDFTPPRVAQQSIPPRTAPATPAAPVDPVLPELIRRSSERLERALVRAITVARQNGSADIGGEHVLLALLGDPDCHATRVLAAIGADLDALRPALARYISTPAAPPTMRLEGAPPVHAFGWRNRLLLAFTYAMAGAGVRGSLEIGTGHLLRGLMRGGEPVVRDVLEPAGVARAAVDAEIPPELGGDEEGAGDVQGR
jgi:ATP-dependent Clp protease ATP-binding subunit ClpA